MKVITKDLTEVDLVAKDFLNKLIPNTSSATVVGLSGDLGSGKTTFSQAVGRNLGIKEFITSPTFVIMKTYDLSSVIPAKPARPSGAGGAGIQVPFKNFVHIDAYRLDSERELQILDFEKLLQDSGNLIFIEWPEKVSGILPTDLIKLNFKFINENEREIEK